MQDTLIGTKKITCKSISTQISLLNYMLITCIINRQNYSVDPILQNPVFCIMVVFSLNTMIQIFKSFDTDLLIKFHKFPIMIQIKASIISYGYNLISHDFSSIYVHKTFKFKHFIYSLSIKNLTNLKSRTH